jgi:hypothetical protein
LIEHGLGETRAALVDGDEIIEARVRREGVIAAGAVLDAKLVAVAPRVLVEAGGEQFLLPRGVSGVTEGARLAIEVAREALGGNEAWKRGLARRSEAAPASAPPLAGGAAGTIKAWDDLLEEARTGLVQFDGGELRIQATAAMTVIDVDGWLIPAKLAQMGAWAAALAIRRLDIGGSTGIDFPTLHGKEERREVDKILDVYLPQPFEKTAITGFGFVLVVRPKQRPSLIELAQDRAAFEARALVRRAGRSMGPTKVTAHPAVIAAIGEEWRARLERQVGGPVTLSADPSLAMSGGHVH